MKKLFFFRSHSSDSVNINQLSPPSTDKQVYWEKPTEKAEKSLKNKHGSEQEFVSSPCLRRSLSFSSGSLYDTEKGLRKNFNETCSPCSDDYYSNKQSRHHPSR